MNATPAESPQERQPQILVVEDHQKVAELIHRGLADEGFAVTVVTSGDDASALGATGRFDLIVLDVMLPGRSGLEVLAELRRQQILSPVIMLTARDSLSDRLHGLDAGADDYLSKPFAFPELLARIRALLRRGRVSDIRRMAIADLELDLISRRVSRGGHTIDLSPREFELLAYLASHAGRVVSREMLGRDVWQQLERGTPLDNVVDVHIGRLRRKIDLPGTQKLIHTVRGLGFMVGVSSRA